MRYNCFRPTGGGNMLRFIIGTNEEARRAALYTAIKDWNKSAFLIVPEQFSFESEKLLGETLGVKDAQNVEVLSFSRLCNSIFRRFGGVAGEYSDDTTKLLLMGAALHECADSLKYYKKNAQSAAFIEKLVRTDSEIKNAGLDFSDLLRLSKDPENGILCDKASDLSAVFALYDAMLSKSFLDPLTDISRACDILSENDFFSETAVFIDSFTGFTGSEYKLLNIILAQSPVVTASLCCPDIYDRTGGTGLFSKTQRTAARLERAAKAAGVSVAKPMVAVLKNDCRPAAISAIEKHFLQSGGKTPENSEEVKIVVAANRYDEAEFVACEARALAKKGFRWREMAVIARNLSPYRHSLSEAFRKAGVPLYSDEPAQIADHPLAAFVSASLDACRENFDSASIMRIIKTGILPVSEEDAAEFENYCFVWDVRGKMFLSAFTGNPKGFVEGQPEDFAPLERINVLREAVCEPLARLRARIAEANGREFAAALYDYLTECRVTEGLRRLYDEYSAAGDSASAEDLDTFWNFLVSAIDKFSAALGEARLGGATLGQLFELVLMSAEIGVLPRTLDCVAAGTADRMRPSGIRAVFIIGACDGEFPAPPKSGSLFTEEERRRMADMGMELAESENDALLSERMYAYTAFTCASERVYLCYPKYDCGGTELSPSVLASRLEHATAVTKISTASLPEDFWLCSEELAFERLSCFGSSSVPAAEALREYFVSRPLWKERAQKLGVAFKPEEFSLKNSQNASDIFGSRLFLSPTRIENYENCPFSYFLKAGLSLKERKKAELSPLSAGSLLHFVLQQIVSLRGGKGLALLPDKELRNDISSVLKEYMNSVFGSAENKSARFLYLFDRISGFLFRLLRRLGEEFGASEFEPYAFELSVGGSAEVGPYCLSTANGHEIVVEGTIDRVDVLKKNGKSYVRVVDYKSGAKKFALSDVYYGINMQMLVYLFSIWKNGRGGLSDCIPAGVLYMPARDSVVSGDRNLSKEGADEEAKMIFRMNGLLLDDKAVLTAMEPGLAGIFIPVKSKPDGSIKASSEATLATLAQMGEIKRHIDSLLLNMAEELYGGNIPALPYKHGDRLSCEHCSFAAVCRRSSAGPFRLMEDFKPDEFYKRVEGDDEHARP